VDLWILPATVLLANVVEYCAHRGPMHHPRLGLKALHRRHSGLHHRYFVADVMHFDSSRDFHAVLFPPVLLLFFGGVTVALGSLAALVLPLSQAALFVATAIAYYLVYELLHFLYHVPPQWGVARMPVVRSLARLHRLHHDRRHMQQRNFNLVFPLCDWLAGTLDTGTTETTRT
jgi:sterol desaturase/sphingolipid hydroxylase (fatty acid hydroxylase superfamily)